MTDQEIWRKKWAGSKAQKPNEFAAQAYELIKERGLKTVLDLGCGDGRDSLYFASKELDVTAVDFSESGIEAIHTANPTVKTIQRDIREVAFAEESFDVIYAHLSLHYFTDAETTAVFDNLYKILKKGGLIFVKCKSIDDPLYGKGEKLGPDIFRDEHTRHFFSQGYMAEKLQRFTVLQLQKSTGVYWSDTSAFVEAVATK